MLLQEIVLQEVMEEIFMILEAMDPAFRRNVKVSGKEFRKLRQYSPSTAAHSVRVARLARDFLSALQSEARAHGVPATELLGLKSSTMGRVGHMHDLGKMDVPKSVLHKPDKLDKDEIVTMSRHVAQTEPRLAKLVGDDKRVAFLMAKYHHEPYYSIDQKVEDGRLEKADAIVAKVSMIVDIFDALTAKDRDYRVPDTRSAAIDRMRSIKALDPILFRKFERWQRSTHAEDFRPDRIERSKAEIDAKYGHRSRKD